MWIEGQADIEGWADIEGLADIEGQAYDDRRTGRGQI